VELVGVATGEPVAIAILVGLAFFSEPSIKNDMMLRSSLMCDL